MSVNIRFARSASKNKHGNANQKSTEFRDGKNSRTVWDY